MSENREWPQNLSDNDLAIEVEDAESIYLAELAYMNHIAEENAGMLPNDFDEIDKSVAKWRRRYDKLSEEIVRRIRADKL